MLWFLNTTGGKMKWSTLSFLSHLSLSRSRLRFQRGFSISEVIIALLLVSLGALFLLRLGQANAAMRTDLLQRHQGVQLATEFAAWSLQGGGASLSLTALQQALNLSEPAPSVVSCFDERCNASQAAENFVQGWRYKLQTALPEARLRICTEAPTAATQPLSWTCLTTPGASNHTVLKLGRQPAFGVAERPFAVVALGSFS
jgi:type IV pilus assembly protein PilV